MTALDYRLDGDRIVRRCSTVWGVHESSLLRPDPTDALAGPAAWLSAYLRSSHAERHGASFGTCTVLDAFSGCGGFGLGVREGLAAAGLEAQIVAGIDVERSALAVYAANLSPTHAWLKNVNGMVDFQLRGSGETATFPYPPAVVDADLERWVGKIDVFVAGPPCQGHSNLNNVTRRADPRNLLYVSAAALGVAVGAGVVVIENVPTVVRSHKDVVAAATALLQGAGYLVTQATIDASRHGCAQARKRHFTFAQRGGVTSALDAAIRATRCDAIPVSAAIADLLTAPPHGIDEPAVLSQENYERIRFLFANDLYELPNEIRPDCHKNGHTYPSVYGRMRWDLPCSTITSGFMSPGRGRFIHAKVPRTLTRHEAARIQGFPDTFDFLPTSAGAIPNATSCRMIADAVPPTLGTVIGLAAAEALATSALAGRYGPHRRAS